MEESFFREALLEAVAGEAAMLGIHRLSFGSEFAVRRYDKQAREEYDEVLSHGPGDAVLGLLNREGVVLENHDDGVEIGTVEPGSARVESDLKTRATIRLTDERWKRRAIAGDMRGVSVGYIRLSLLREERGTGGVPVRFYSWRPYEISLLTVPPADETVGIGRSKTMENSKLEQLLSLALSGSRKAEVKFTRAKMRNYSLHSVLKTQMGGRYIPAVGSYELEVHQELERSFGLKNNGTVVPFGALLLRDMTATQFAAGGALVQPDMHPVIELLYNRLVCIPLGAQVITGLTGNYIAPQETTSVAPAMASEIGAAPQSQIVLSQDALAPCRATVQVPISLQLLRQTAGVAEDTVRRGIRRALGVLMDHLSLFGQGAGNEPLGIFNTPGVGSVVFGGAADWSHVLNFEKQISLASADGESLGWGISPNTRSRWKNLSRIAGTNFPSFIMESGRVNDYPAQISMQFAGQDQCVFGNWSDFYILIWYDGIDMLLDEVTQAGQGRALLTAHIWFNVLPLHPQSFCVSADSANQ
ncbi:MAG: Caudovirus prohead protease family protein [Pedosphaera sp.]|nr:Caudovirus prohead protease family protein [Pedosphaera sp.]